MDLHLALDRLAGHSAAQIAAELRAAVRSGRLAGGTRLPPSRTLAADMGVSRGPVVEAYEQLVAEGFLVSRQGSGTWVADLCRVRAAVGSADDMVLVAGVAQGLSLTVRALVASGRSLLAVEDPTGVRTRPLLRAAGAKLVPVPVDAEGFDVAFLRRTAA